VDQTDCAAALERLKQLRPILCPDDMIGCILIEEESAIFILSKEDKTGFYKRKNETKRYGIG